MPHLGTLRNLFHTRTRRRPDAGAAHRRARPLTLSGPAGLRLEDRTLLSTTYPLSTSAWTAIGPAPIVDGAPFGDQASGRITGIAADPTNANVIYVASAGGGVWKTTNGGTSWTPLTDGQVTDTMGAIAVAKTNANVVYAGTGEANNSGDSYYGEGILKSTNGGSTWTLETDNGVFSGLTTAKIAVDPTNANVVYAAMDGEGVNGTYGNQGLYKSTDGGSTWSLSYSNTNFDDVSDVVIDPSNTSTVYMAVGTVYGSTNNGVYKSTNGGSSWSPVYTLGGSASFGRISLAIAPSNDQVLYAAIESTTTSGLSRFVTTANGGTSWTVLSSTPNFMGGQGWYDQWVAVSPTNPANVFVGGSAGTNSVMESTTSGASWSDISFGPDGTAPHVDHHAVAFDANGKLLDGNDGGIWRLSNATIGSISWANLNGSTASGALNITQFQGVAVNPSNPNQALGGSQDNGTELFNDSVGWTETDGGDGGTVLYSKQNPSLVYRVSPIGSFGTSAYFRVSHDGGQSWSSATNGITGAANTNFYPTIAVDPSNGARVFLGGSNIYASTNSAASWGVYASAGSAGFNPSGNTVDAIAVAPSNGNTVYAAVGGEFAFASSIYVTTNNGGSWTDVSLPGSGRVNEIDVDPTNSQVAYAVVSSFGSGNVWRTANGGSTWTNISGNLPDQPAWSLQISPTTGTLYVGNDTGVYVTTNLGGSWSPLGTGFPAARVLTLDLEPQLNILAAGTHGRGMWEILTRSTQPTSVTTTTANGTYGAGTVIPITVAFTSAVTVTGTPTLALNSGGTATYASGSGTDFLTFNYTVGASDSSADLDYASTSALSLNGGSILDPSNSPATLTLPAPGSAGSLGSNSSIVIGNTVTGATVTGVTSTNNNGSYGVGAVISIVVNFSGSVTVTGTPRLSLNDGGTAHYFSGSGTSALTFRYTVAAGQNAADLDYASTSALILNGGTIKNSGASTSANLTLPAPGAAGSLGASKAITIDTVAPVVTGVSTTTPDGIYGLNGVVTISVGFSKAVVVTGVPQLALNDGGSARYTSGSGTSTLTFTYTVGAGQTTSHLDEASASALTLNSGTIKDTDNSPNSAVLTLPAPGSAGSLGAGSNIVVDTVAPTVTGVTSTTPDGTYGVGAVVNVDVAFSKTVVVTGTPRLALNSGGTATYSSGSGTNTLVFTYTVAAGENSTDLDYASTSALTLNGSSITDTDNSGNNANLTLPAPGSAGSLGASSNIVVSTSTPTSTSLTASTLTPVYSQPVTLTATVNGAPHSNPTGTVTFLDGTTSIGTGSVAADGTATLTTSALGVGTHSITASYGGDLGDTPSTSTAVSVTVKRESTTTTLTGSGNPVTDGGSVIYSATVAPASPGTATPAGTVQFKIDGSPYGSPVTLGVNGKANSPAISGLSYGLHSVAVVFTPDSSGKYIGSNAVLSGGTTFQSTTTTSLAASTATPSYGQTLTLTATVAAKPGAATPTGQVQFLFDGKPLGGAILSGGVATLHTTSLPLGAHTITATYAGSNAAAKSTSAGVPVTETQASTSTALAASVSTATYGAPVTFTATLTNTSSAAAVVGGSVSFYDTSVSPQKLLGSVALVTGKAVFTTSTLGAGSTPHTVIAVYGGSTNFAGSTSPTSAGVTVNQAATSTALTSTSTGPVPYGTPVSFTARVGNASGSSAVPTGLVTFYLDSTSGTALGHATLAANGKATLSNVVVPGGSHTVFAVYGGTSNFAGSTSASLGQVVNPEGTTTSLTDNASGSVPFGTSVTFNVTVADADPGLPLPSGSVNLYDNASGTPKLLAIARLVNGQATWSTTALAKGTHTIDAVFAATSNYGGSQSSVVTVTVV
jgi:hypothetical protein